MYLTISQYKYTINESQFNLLNENIFKKIGNIAQNKLVNRALTFFDVDEELIQNDIKFRELLNKDIELIKKLHLGATEVSEFLANLIIKLQVLPVNVQVSLFKTVIVSLIGIISFTDIMGVFNTVENIKTKTATTNVIYEGFPELEKVVQEYKEELETAKPSVVANTIKTNKKIFKAPTEFSDTLVNFLKYEEGSVTDKGEPVLTAYALGDDKITIGYGHTEDISTSKMIPGVTTITYDQAVDLLVNDIKEAQNGIDKIINKLKINNITQGMYDAMISLAYNRGINKIKNSDFIKLIKNNKFKDAENEILSMSSHNFEKFPGLKTRREKEALLFASLNPNTIENNLLS